MTEIAHKSFTPHGLKLDDETGSIELAFAQLNVIDKDGDVTLPGAFPVKNVPMSAYGHTSWDGALPVGRGTITEEGGWALFRGKMFMDTTAGRETHATLKGLGELAEFSYGYSVLMAEGGSFEGQRVRFLKGLDPHEVSPVLRGAGVGTHTRAIKSGRPGSDVPYAEHLDWVLDEVKALTDRSRDRADWRAKEGRVLSEANRDRLAALRDALKSVGVDLDDLLTATAPEPKSFDVTALVLAAEAQRLGVAI